eukprot:TRINITY_DN7293_c0_g1_i1.p1 TRINITY_DN7293_c0_g1~~TRINITY_DN7293_c0_g1_i1.p1  ORF type:complete len:205 (-),score=28.18 TRINITY_DN7293_c0_g1_i1:332-946(-)
MGEEAKVLIESLSGQFMEKLGDLCKIDAELPADVKDVVSQFETILLDIYRQLKTLDRLFQLKERSNLENRIRTFPTQIASDFDRKDERVTNAFIRLTNVTTRVFDAFQTYGTLIDSDFSFVNESIAAIRKDFQREIVECKESIQQARQKRKHSRDPLPRARSNPRRVYSFDLALVFIFSVLSMFLFKSYATHSSTSRRRTRNSR